MIGTRAVRRTLAASLGAALVASAGAAVAQPVDVPPTWGGDLWSRPRLTGSWGGLRDDLGKKGVVLDVDLLLTPQDIWNGGLHNDAGFWGNAEYTLNVDTQKLGLWPGGFLKFEGLTSFGESVVADTGAIVPANTAPLLTVPNEDASALMNATFTQFLSTKFGLFVGKINTFEGFHGEFSGSYRTQFWNMGMLIPMAMDLVPISAYGGGIIVLPWDGAVLATMVIDPNGTPDADDPDDWFDDGATLVSSFQIEVKPFGRVGKQTVGGTWSSANRTSLIQDPTNIATSFAQENFPFLQNPGRILTRIIEQFFPGLIVPAQPANREDDTWGFFYALEQYLWQPEGDPKRGIGIFFNFGVSDADTNPVQYSYTLGIGGKGVVPCRPHDSFGVGWAHTDFSDEFVPFLRANLDLGLEHEDAVEIYYNVAVTSWLNLTFDLQVIETGLQKKPVSGPSLDGVETAVVGGVRAYIRF